MNFREKNFAANIAKPREIARRFLIDSHHCGREGFTHRCVCLSFIATPSKPSAMPDLPKQHTVQAKDASRPKQKETAV